MEDNKKKDKLIYSNIRQGNNIESLISAPLVAVSKANMMMLSGQTRFILNNCFTQKEGSYNPIMVNMSICRGTVNGKESSLNFQVPLLCLLPLNSLAIENARLKFNIDITSTYSYSPNDDTDLLPRKSVLNGRIVRDRNCRTESSAHMKVDINASTIPLPTGTRALIELYSKVILPNDSNDNTDNK